MLHKILWTAALVLHAALCHGQTADRSFTLQDHVGRTWSNELVHYDITFPPGQAWAEGLYLRDSAGKPLPVQLSDATKHSDGSLASAKVWFVVDELAANASQDFRLTGAKKGVVPAQPSSDLSLAQEKGAAVLATSRVAVRVLLGEEKFATPVSADKLPAPIQGVRLRNGAWAGRGWFETKHLCARYSARVTDDGPVFKKSLVRYDFAKPDNWQREGKLFYEMTVRVVAGQEIAYITEEFNLGDPKIYQYPHFASEAEETLWDWWCWRPHQAADNFCFSLTAGGTFKPTQARCIEHNVTTPTKGHSMNVDSGENEYPLPFAADRLEFTLNALTKFQPDQALHFTLFRAEDPSSDVVSLLPCRPGLWRNPDILPHEPVLIKQHTDTSDLRVYSTAAREVFVRCPLHLGRREWAIAVLKNPGVISPEVRDFTPISKLLAKYGGFPLDKVKDWTLQWPDPHRYAAAPPEKDTPLGKQYREVSELFARFIHEAMDWPRGGERTGINAFPPNTSTAVQKTKTMLESGQLTADQGRQLRAQAAFLTHLLWDDDYFPPRRNGYGGGSANMPVSVARGRMEAAAGLNDHPMSKTWLAQSAKVMGYTIDASFGEDGSPQSNPHYMGIGIDTAVCAARVLGETGAIKDIQASFPRFHKAARFLVDMLTPVDVRFGQRLVPTVGDAYWERHHNAATTAPVFKDSDPQLAANLLWAAQAGGEKEAAVAGIEPKMPQLKSVVYPGWGAFLRRGAGTAAESYLGIRFGDFTLDHTHNDAGSINWYARGVPLSMDFATMYTPHTPGAWLHSTLTYDHREQAKAVMCPGRGHKDCFYTGKSWYEHAVEPHSVLEPITDRASTQFTEVHGKITAFATQPAADYVRGEANRRWFERKPYYDRDQGSPSPWSQFTEWDKLELKHPFGWVRQFAFVTDEKPDGPNYLVIADDLTGNEELTPAFNFWCLAKEVKQSASGQLHFTGQHGMDLDMFALWPREGRIQLGEWGHRQNFLVGSPGMEENQKLARVYAPHGGQGFLAVLYPRKADEPEPKVESLANGKLVKLTLPDQTHWILLSREPVSVADSRVKITGTAAVVKQWKDGRSQISLLAKGAAVCDGLVLESAEAASKSK